MGTVCVDYSSRPPVATAVTARGLPAPPNSRPMEQVAGTLLVVDDDPRTVRVVGELLAGYGYDVHVAESGDRALDVVNELIGTKPLDLILLDILMPGALGGIETCRAFKAIAALQNTPVIFLTGRDDDETMLRAFEAGAADYVLKPVNADVLLARVRTHCRLGLLSRTLEAALAERTRELVDANVKLRHLAMQVSLIAEREKRRLAVDLHDSPMQKLALAQAQVA